MTTPRRRKTDYVEQPSDAILGAMMITALCCACVMAYTIFARSWILFIPFGVYFLLLLYFFVKALRPVRVT